MRALLPVLLMVSASAAAAPPPSAVGRWRGLLHVPGNDLALVVDLEQDANGAWLGSATIPGLNVGNVALSGISLAGNRVAFAIPNALGAPPDGPAAFTGELKSSATLSGSLALAGNTAPFLLTRDGSPQVERPPASTPVEAALEGTWRGDYQLSGYAHHVTLGFKTRGSTPPTVEFLLVGKQPHTLAVTLVSEHEGLLRVESPELSVNFEGRLDAPSGELRGVVEQGQFEAPIVLKRSTGSAP